MEIWKDILIIIITTIKLFMTKFKKVSVTLKVFAELLVLGAEIYENGPFCYTNMF